MNPRVFVVWIDSSIQNGQVGASDYPRPERIESIGWLVAENEEHVLIARDSHRDDEFRGLLSIPLCAITTRSVL